YFGGEEPVAVKYDFVASGDKLFSQASDSTNEDQWYKLLAGPVRSWRHAFISTSRVVQGSNFVPNPARKVL
ncbi:hypothetical protein OGATHE_001755, partial [Ogataea polymorpha]